MGKANLNSLQRIGTATTATFPQALQVLQHIVPDLHQVGKNSLAVPLPRREAPTHVLVNNHCQPWELLPAKLAAERRYPNFFNASCMFFGSIGRDVARTKPDCLIRPTQLGLDLAKVLRNLGIISSFEITQRMGRCQAKDFIWPSEEEPDSVMELKLYPYKLLKLNLRWDMHKPVWQSDDAPLSNTPLSTSDALPLSVQNISKASQPVLMTPEQVIAARSTYPSGIFIMFHHQLGLITDATAEHYGLSCLAMAHLGLPHSHVAQIQGAMRQKHRVEGSNLANVMPLQKWSMVDYVRQVLVDRAAALHQSAEVNAQKKQIKLLVQQTRRQVDAQLAEHDISDQLHQEFMAWQLKHKLRGQLTPSPSNTATASFNAPSTSSGHAPVGRPSSSQGPSREWEAGATASRSTANDAPNMAPGRSPAGRPSSSQGSSRGRDTGTTASSSSSSSSNDSSRRGGNPRS